MRRRRRPRPQSNKIENEDDEQDLQEIPTKKMKLSKEESEEQDLQETEAHTKKKPSLKDVEEFMENFIILRPGSWNDYDSTVTILNNLCGLLLHSERDDIQHLIDKDWDCRAARLSSFPRTLFNKIAENKLTEKTAVIWYNAMDLLTNKDAKFSLLSKSLFSTSYTPLDYMNITRYHDELHHYSDKQYFLFQSQETSKIKVNLLKNYYNHHRDSEIVDRSLFGINVSPSLHHKYYIIGNAFTNQEKVRKKGTSYVLAQFTSFAMEELVTFNVHIPFMHMVEDWFCDDERGDVDDFDFYGDDWVDQLFEDDLMHSSLKDLIDSSHWRWNHILAVIYMAKMYHFEYKSEIIKVIENEMDLAKDISDVLLQYLFEDLSYLQFDKEHETKWKMLAQQVVNRCGTKQWKDWFQDHIIYNSL